MFKNIVFFFSIFMLTFLLAACGGDSPQTEDLRKEVVQGPSVPSGLISAPVSQSQIDLSWDVSGDPGGNLDGYKIYENGDFLKKISANSISITDLLGDSLYCFAVSAVDASGYESEQTSQSCSKTYTQQTISFDPPKLATGSVGIVSYQEKGMVFLGDLPSPFIHTDAGVNIRPNSDGAYLNVYNANSYFQMEDHSLFNLLSVDLAEYSEVFNYPKNITFVCHKSDSSSAVVTFRIDGIVTGPYGSGDFETFNFPSVCSDLEYVEIVSQMFSIDNVIFASSSTMNSRQSNESYHISLSRNYDIMRDGDINDQVYFVVEIDDEIALTVNGKGILNYRYWRILSSKFRVWLVKYLNNENVIVSNIIEYYPTFSNNSYSLTIGPSYEITRDGFLNDELVWVTDIDGTIVEEISGSGIMKYSYKNNIEGKHYRVWLKSADIDNPEVLSNIIDYTIPTSQPTPYNLTVDSSYTVTRSGSLGDPLTWVIEKNGVIVLERNAANELSYSYYLKVSGDYFRIWLEKFIDGRYQIVSNSVDYVVQ